MAELRLIRAVFKFFFFLILKMLCVGLLIAR